MKQLESLRNKKIEEYVFNSQVVFLILLGILLVRANNISQSSLVATYINFSLVVLPVAFFVVIKLLEKKKRFKIQELPDLLINLLYLGFTVNLLIYESESYFKFLLLMPVMVSALKHGIKKGYFWAFVASLGLAVIDYAQKAQHIDADLLVAGIIWLFAWLVGKMSETEKEIREQLQQQAELDGLTGVYNHRSFHHLLDEYFIKTKITGMSLTLLMLDVDFFKYYNDAYGHQKGDEALSRVASIIDMATREWGVCARYGGDEFAVILPNCTNKNGLMIGEFIHKKVEEAVFEGANILPSGHLSVSIGVASYPKNADTKDRLIDRADEALYKAKYTNTNKVQIYYSVFDEIGRSLQDKDKDILNSMRTLMMVVNAKDRYTYGHCERVMHYSLQIARRMSLSEEEIQNLTVGAFLHDIGKIEITRDVLNKPGKLTAKEQEAMRHHSIWGADYIRPIASFSSAVDIILYHHEDYNGSGYPFGISENEIPLGARILRVADSFDAMTTNRPYKKVHTISEAIKDLNIHRGKCYDPDVLDVFIEYIIENGITPGSTANTDTS